MIVMHLYVYFKARLQIACHELNLSMKLHYS